MPACVRFVVLLVAIAGLAGCGHSAPPATPVLPSPSPSALRDDPPGSVTCGLLGDAVSNGTLMDPGVVDAIVAAAAAADAPLADSAQRLADAHTAAVAAHGRSTEPDAVAAVSEAGTEMIRVCDDYGLATVG